MDTVSPHASHRVMMEALRRGIPGLYAFHLIQGESWEAFEDMVAEAKHLAQHFEGTWRHLHGTTAQPESFEIELPSA